MRLNIFYDHNLDSIRNFVNIFDGTNDVHLYNRQKGENVMNSNLQ